MRKYLIGKYVVNYNIINGNSFHSINKLPILAS